MEEEDYYFKGRTSSAFIMQESADIKITINDKTDEKIKEPTESLFS